MAVLIGDLVLVTTISDDNRVQLETPYGVQTVQIGDATFVYVAGLHDDGISAFGLRVDGSVTSLQNIRDNDQLNLAGAANFASAKVGGTSYLYVNAARDDGISVFRINPSGTLTNIQNIQDSDLLELNDTAGRMSVATVGAKSFLIASGKDDNGISVFEISGNGTLTNTYNVTDDSELNLNDAMDIAAETVGGRTFIFVASEDNDGISAFELHADGTLTNTDNVTDDDTVNLSQCMAVATAKLNGTTYLIASGKGDDGLSVFSINSAGQLQNVFNIADDATLGLDAAQGLTVFTLDTETFVAVSGRDDDALSVFHLSEDGTLSDMSTIFDDAQVALDNTHYNAFASVGDKPLLIGTGAADDGFSVFEIGSGADRLVGTGTSDHLLAFGGDDWLDGAGGNDIMRGGSGNDTYVVDRADDLVVERKGAGNDQVEAEVSYRLGSHVEKLVLRGDKAIDGTGNGLSNLLTGNGAANRLTGQKGKDILRGGGGDDDLRGGHGKDTLFGSKGSDDLYGGKGSDRLLGQGGADNFIFKAISDSGPNRNTRDRIDSFKGKDQIVLRAIDADKTQKGDQNFSLDADGSFDAGEIRLRETKAGLLVEMNIDVDAKAEMSILLKGYGGTLDGADFLF